MTVERFFERISDFQKAVARLSDALKVPVDEYIRDAVIQRFEFSYELAWKTIKLYLEIQDKPIRTPKDAFREALQIELIRDGNGWSLLHEKRNLTSHTYDEALAKDVYDFVRERGIYLLLDLERELQRRIEKGEL